MAALSCQRLRPYDDRCSHLETRNSKLETSSPHCCGVNEMFSPVVSSTSFFLDPIGGLET